MQKLQAAGAVAALGGSLASPYVLIVANWRGINYHFLDIY
jgi:hypothetical protein